jgi:hypothetical protein
MKEEMLYRNLQRMRDASVIGVDFGSDVKMLEKMVEDAREEIADKAVLIIPRFIDIANSLGLDRDGINGLAGIAGLLVYDKFASYKKSINYLGLYKARGRDGRRNKKYSRKIQRYLIMLTNTILWKNGEKHPPTFKEVRKILKMVIEVRRQMGLAEQGAGV